MHKKFNVLLAAVSITAAGLVTAGTAPAYATATSLSGCSAYVSATDAHKAVGWCNSGTGDWWVHAYCAGPGAVYGPYTGTKGGRHRPTEQASVFSCGSGAYPVTLSITHT
jgi:hypothetical protein